jgi:type VI secretion system secreted protein Hcp
LAAGDYFLRIDGVSGESTDSKHKGEIDVESWSWGETQSAGHEGGGGGGGAGKVRMQDFHFVMRFNKASPALILACASGKHLKSALLTCRKAGKGQQEFLTFAFDDVLVSSFQTGGSEATDVVPMDQVSLNFSKIHVEYKAQKPDGSLDSPITVGWDLKKNQKL